MELVAHVLVAMDLVAHVGLDPVVVSVAATLASLGLASVMVAL